MNCLLGTMHGSRRAQRGVNLCEFALVEQSHLHATHRESFTPTPAKLQHWCQPGRTLRSLGHSRGVTGSQIYATKPMPAPATNVIT